jgi:hypothetical protein
MKITQLHALRVRIPQKPPIAPYQSRYRASSTKESLLVRLETDNGLVGWGETPDDWISKSYEGTPEERLRRAVLGRSPFDIEAWYAENNLGSSYLASGVEMARWDLMGQALRQPPTEEKGANKELAGEDGRGKQSCKRETQPRGAAGDCGHQGRGRKGFPAQTATRADQGRLMHQCKNEQEQPTP